MRPGKTETDGSGDVFRARLDQIIDMGHELVRLARREGALENLPRARPAPARRSLRYVR